MTTTNTTIDSDNIALIVWQLNKAHGFLECLIRLTTPLVTKMKTIISASVVSVLLFISPAYAAHELAQQAAEPKPDDSHISWHEFRHDLGSYAGVTAVIDHHGVITLAGHVDSVPEKRRVNNLAIKVRGATEVKNLIGTD